MQLDPVLHSQAFNAHEFSGVVTNQLQPFAKCLRGDVYIKLTDSDYQADSSLKEHLAYPFGLNALLHKIIGKRIESLKKMIPDPLSCLGISSTPLPTFPDRLFTPKDGPDREVHGEVLFPL